MKKTKLILTILLCITAISFIACSSPSNSGSDNSGNTGTAGTGTGGSGGGNENSTVTYIGTKAPAEAKAVGDIVFNDGSAMAYTDWVALENGDDKTTKKNAAIALIFYKGTGLNSDVNNVADTTTSRTLGVGLKHNKNGLALCTSSANARNKNITTIQCSASGDAGSLTFTGDKNGSNNLEQIAAFLSAEGSETTDDTTGEGASDRYPAFYFGKNYATSMVTNIAANSEFATGWYLPSIAELFQIYACRADTTNGFDIDAASEALGGDKFEDLMCRSSSQNAFSDRPWCGIYFYDGDWDDGGDIDASNSVCCSIRAFN